MRRYGQQHESSTLTSELAWLGGQYKRFNRKDKKEPTQNAKRRERESALDVINTRSTCCGEVTPKNGLWKPQSSLRWNMFQPIRAGQHFEINVVFLTLCMCRNLFFSEERASVVKNKKHYFPTKALVQCMNDAQPEFLREKAQTLHISAKGLEVDFVFGILCCTNKSQRFPTKALVQCMDHEQPECSSFTKLSCWLKPKSRFCVSNFALYIQSTMLF